MQSDPAKIGFSPDPVLIRAHLCCTGLNMAPHGNKWSPIDAVACKGQVMPGATAWLDAPYQILVLSSGVGPSWSLLPNIRCLWCHDMTSYARLQTNVLAKLVDTTCVFKVAGAAAGQGEQ